MASNGVASGQDLPRQPTHAVSDMGSEKSPAFQFYPKDFLSSSKVQRMSLTEQGIYVRLLCHCWLDGSLPDDVAAIARMVGVRQSQFARIWAGAISECFTERDGRLINERLDEERNKQADFRRRASDWGKKGGRPSIEPDLVKGTLSKIKLSDLQSSVSDLQSSNKEEKDISAETHSVSPPEPSLLDFQTDGKDRMWALTQSRVDGWESAYPNLDVLGECRKAHAWLMANPERRKTAKGMPTFLVNWLNRAVYRGSMTTVKTYSRLPEWAQ